LRFKLQALPAPGEHTCSYTADMLLKRYDSYRAYVTRHINEQKALKMRIKLPGFPEEITTNIVKFALYNKLNDLSGRYRGEIPGYLTMGDDRGVIQCQSIGGASSIISATCDVVWILDIGNWRDDQFIIYRIKKMPRGDITWEFAEANLAPECMYIGGFDDVFVSTKYTSILS
jgi:hypothetical protein